MRMLSRVVLGLCFVLVPVLAAAADHSGDPNWIQDSQSGCWIYNASPQLNESIVWTGANCPYGEEANGSGKTTWFENNSWTLVEEGEMQNGLMEGAWVRRFANGNVDHSNWVDGVRQEESYADQDNGSSSGGGGSTYTPTYDSDAYMETLKRQNRENCERAAKGANIACHPE